MAITRIPLANMDIGALETKYVNEALVERQLSGTAAFVGHFENALAERIARQHVIACGNGTLALLVALMALDIGPGDEVIIPALTFAAPAAMVRVLGATPVFADVRRDNWTLSVERVTEKLTYRTRAIIAVDVMGHGCDLSGLPADIPVIEDAAEALGGSAFGKPIGSFGLLSTFSFHANKPLTTGEGGAIATDDEPLAARLRLLVHHGVPAGQHYAHSHVALNARLPNLSAAVGIGQIERWDELLAKRHQVYQWYDNALSTKTSRYSRRPVSSWAVEAPWFYTLQDTHAMDVVHYLQRAGIDARRVFPVVPSNVPFRDGQCYPVSEMVAKTAFWLPTSSLMTQEDVEYVVENLP